MIGLAVVMPGSEGKLLDYGGDKMHTVRIATVHSGEPLTYWFGSCWSKGEIKDFQQWSGLVKEFAQEL